MSHPSDKDLDRLSREAAEQYDVEPSTSGWEALQKRLDKELPREEDKDRRRFLWLLILITALCGGGLTWMIAGNITGKAPLAQQTAPAANPTIQKTETPATGDQQHAANNKVTNASKSQGTAGDRQVQPENGTANAPVAQQVQSENGATNAPAEQQVQPENGATNAPVASSNARNKPALSASGSQKTNREHLVSTQRQQGNNSRTDASGNARTLDTHRHNNDSTLARMTVANNSPTLNRKGTGRRSATTLRAKDQVKNNVKEDDIAVVHNRKKDGSSDQSLTSSQEQINRENNAAQQKNNNSAVSQNKPKPAEQDNTVATDSTALAQNSIKPAADSTHKDFARTANQPDSNAVAVKKKPTPKQTPQRGLEIGLLAGPDVSNIAFRNSNKTGYNFGLQLGYRLSSRWSVNAGVIYTKKNYDAGEKDYHPSKAYYYPNTELDKVDGYCQMLDIPVNVRYNLTTAPKATWFVSTGVSSYLMKHQYYDYYTHNTTTGATGIYGWDNRKPANYLFSILNVSAGWEKSLSNHVSFQAEPYLKLPLKGVGYGKMMINSYGVLLSVKYKPTFHSAKK